MCSLICFFFFSSRSKSRFKFVQEELCSLNWHMTSSEKDSNDFPNIFAVLCFHHIEKHALNAVDLVYVCNIQSSSSCTAEKSIELFTGLCGQHRSKNTNLDGLSIHFFCPQNNAREYFNFAVACMAHVSQDSWQLKCWKSQTVMHILSNGGRCFWHLIPS